MEWRQKFASIFQFFPSPIPRWDCASGPRGAWEKCRCVGCDTIYFAHCRAIRKRMRAHLLTDILTQDVKPDNVLFVDAAYLQGKLEMALTCADLIGWEQDIMDITGNSGLKPGHCQFDIEAD